MQLFTRHTYKNDTFHATHASVSVEKSSGFSADFYYFRGLFAHFDQIKDFEEANILYKVFIFIERLSTHYILHYISVFCDKYELTGIEPLW